MPDLGVGWTRQSVTDLPERRFAWSGLLIQPAIRCPGNAVAIFDSLAAI